MIATCGMCWQPPGKTARTNASIPLLDAVRKMRSIHSARNTEHQTEKRQRTISGEGCT